MLLLSAVPELLLLTPTGMSNEWMFAFFPELQYNSDFGLSTLHYGGKKAATAVGEIATMTAIALAAAAAAVSALPAAAASAIAVGEIATMTAIALAAAAAAVSALPAAAAASAFPAAAAALLAAAGAASTPDHHAFAVPQQHQLYRSYTKHHSLPSPHDIMVLLIP